MNESQYSKKDRAITKTYLKELSASIITYMVVLFGAIFFAKTMQDDWLRTVVVLTPIIPAVGLLWAIIRHIKRMDEYLRVWIIEVIALAGALTALFCFSYGFLEGIGYPKMSGFLIYVFFMVSWMLISAIRKFMER